MASEETSKYDKQIAQIQSEIEELKNRQHPDTSNNKNEDKTTDDKSKGGK